MRLRRIVVHRLRSLLRRPHQEAALQREIDLHLEQLVKQYVADGMSESGAKREARLQFGAPEVTKEHCRDMRRVNIIEDFVKDVFYALRVFRKSPGFTLTALVSLALGIGANTIVFSVLNALVLKPLPVTEPGRIQFVNNRGTPANSFPAYRDIRDRNTVFESLFDYRITQVALENDSNGARRIWGYLVTGNYFESLGIQPALGRFFTPAEDMHLNASPYAVLSYACWLNRFGGDPTIVGKDIRLNRHPYRVLGVAPRGFHGTEVFYWAEIWVPMMMQPRIEGNSWLDCRECFNSWIAGRLKRGVSVEQAEANLQTIAEQLGREHRVYEGMKLTLSPPGMAGSTGREPTRAFAGGVMLLASLVLFAACANLAVLLVARGADRERELGIRLAIGAGRGRIVRQLLTESLVISIGGGIAGCAVAAVLLQILSQWRAPLEFPVQFDVSPDWRVFLFTSFAAVATGVLFGLGPARRAWKVDPAVSVKGTAAPTSVRRWAAHDLLLPLQIALCCVLVTSSLVAVRGLMSALQSPLGFRPDGAAVAGYDVGLAAYDGSRGRAFQQRAFEEVARLPGVEAAAYASSVPLSIDQSTTTVYPENTTDFRNKNAHHSTYYYVSPGYFHTVGTRLMSGREFAPQDDRKSLRVAIVNQTFARRILGIVDAAAATGAVGRRFRRGREELVKVAGVVEDGRYESLTETPKATVFFPILQSDSSSVVLIARSRRPEVELAAEMRQVITRLDPHLAVYGAGGLRQMLGLVYLPMHAAVITLGAFGVLALMLAITGVYGLSAYTVSRRSREIGIRMAIGARPGQVLRFVFGRIGTLVAAGALLGLALGVAGAGVLASIVYHATSRDPVVIGVSVLTMLSVGLAAALGPARRSIGIDPLRSLRQE